MSARATFSQYVFKAWRPAAAPSPMRHVLAWFEGLAAIIAVFIASTVWMAPDEATGTSREKTRPGWSRDFRLADTGEVVIAAYTGAPYTYASDVKIKAPNLHDLNIKDVDWIGEPFDGPIYYGVRIVRWGKSTRSGWMLDFTHSKVIAEPSQLLDMNGLLDGEPAQHGKAVKEVFDKLEASHGHNMLTLNGLIRLPRWHARLHPYAGLGAGVSLPHAEVHFKGNAKRTYEYQYAGPVAQFVFGLEFRAARTSYFLEYKFSFAPYDLPLSERNGTLLIFDLWNQAKDWWSGTAPPAGRLTTDFASHQVVGGLGVRIVPVPAMAQ